MNTILRFFRFRNLAIIVFGYILLSSSLFLATAKEGLPWQPNTTIYKTNSAPTPMTCPQKTGPGRVLELDPIGGRINGKTKGL